MDLSVEEFAEMVGAQPNDVELWEAGKLKASHEQFHNFFQTFWQLKVENDGRRVCGIKGCGKLYKARGFCSTHYIHFKRHGFFGGEECAREGCQRVVDSNGLCYSHRRCEYIKTPRGRESNQRNFKKYISKPENLEKHRQRELAYAMKMGRRRRQRSERVRKSLTGRTLGQYIKMCRREAGATREKWEALTGINRFRLGFLERDRVDITEEEIRILGTKCNLDQRVLRLLASVGRRAESA